MTAVRIVPCLDVRDGRVVKGINFESIRDAGDPVEAAKRYCDEGADEVVFLDISATLEGRGTLLKIVEATARQLSIPLTVGGGVRELKDVERLLASGADRISVNSAAIAAPALVDDITARYGNQVLVVAIDVKRVDGHWAVTTHGGTRKTDRTAAEWALELQQRGAGELLVTSMDRDGTKNGYDLSLLRALFEQGVTIPVIASGGVGKLEHFQEGAVVGASALLAASVFHDRLFSIEAVKDYLRSHGAEVRLR